MAQDDTRKDGPLFIVDNSPGGRSGADYLREWCELARSFDIATGFFEIGSLLELDGAWQKLEKIRILMGDELTFRTKKAMLEAVQRRAEGALEKSLDADKIDNPFLEGAPAIVEALTSGKIEARVYNRDKFHAKAYITHGKFDVIGSQALVGSSNFTRPGLKQNIELNIKLESSSEVAQLQDWYEEHWAQSVDVTPEVLRVIQRHTAEYTPFEVYARALQELFSDREVGASEWELGSSRMFGKLDRYQKEAYWALTNIGRQHGGAFLCDGVGLGKTYVGLMLIERLVLHENKRVVLFAPKAVKDAVWEPELRRHLPHIGGIGGSADFSNLTVFSHTDLSRRGDFPERFERIAELADVVLIDEAHHFRNRGRLGDEDSPEDRSRYYRLFDLLGGGDEPKPLYMLTATPINNSLTDFRNLIELFTRQDDSHFSRTLGVTSVSARLNTLTKELKKRVGADADIGENLTEAEEVLGHDDLFKGLVVQRSRAYAKASQILETGYSAAFPERSDPQVANYSIRKSYGSLLALIDKAFEKKNPLFTLAVYYPLAYYKGSDESIDPFEYERQKQVVGLIRTNFLKRFESSVHAFERSCDRLMRRLLAFVQVNSETDGELKRFQRWIDQHAEVLARTKARQLELFGATTTEDEEEEDIVPPELLAKFDKLDRSEFDVTEILQETFLDLDQLAMLVAECQRFEPKHDDKLRCLTRLLKSKPLADRKVLLFTEFADTARYLRRELTIAGISGLAQLDSNSKVDRAEVIRRFAPYYNGLSSPKLAQSGKEEIRVLLTTDVLAEGLNLQDATYLINFDIHWNPVRLMQRIGRVDRRLSPTVEAQLVTDHPHLADDRGKVAFWNFLPPDELDVLLNLYQKVSHKTLIISKTLGIEGKKLLTPKDDYAALKEFNSSYEGETTSIEQLHLEYQKLIEDDATLEIRLASLPSAVFSGRATADGPSGVFLCFRLPALDTEAGEFSLLAGVTRWYFAVDGDDTIIDDPAVIAPIVRSLPTVMRLCIASKAQLKDTRDRVQKHIKNTYLKRLDAPVTSPAPLLVAWLEVNGGS